MIRREDVEDLQPGDVVELRWDEYPGHVVQSVVRQEHDGKHIGPGLLAWSSGEVATWIRDDTTLTVVSRAPRPLYTNSDRTEPAMGDIARDRYGVAWQRHSEMGWNSTRGVTANTNALRNSGPLTLLWDGETGQVVQ